MLRFLLKRKIIVGLFITFVFVFGFISLSKLDKEILPPVSFGQTIIMVESEDMPATDVEQFVTEPIEKAINGIKGVESYHSTSTVGNSTIFVDLEDANGSDITQEIESKVRGLNDLHNVKDIFVMQASTDQPYEFFMDISGDNLKEMTDFAKKVVKPRLEELPEVREVALSGLEEKEIIIELKRDKLNDFQLSQEEVIGTIQQLDINESIGELESEKNEPTIRWNTTFANIDDLKNISIPTQDGIKKLKDIATIKVQENEQTQVTWKNGDPNFILVQIGRVNDVTQIDMASAVRAEVEKIKKEDLPKNIQFDEVAAQADYVSSAIEGVTQNILIGGIIAIVVLLLFLRNIRATIIIGLSIPASILLTILTMTVFDYSFNLMSLIGLGLGIGMMVDASIVVLESIYKKKEQGFSNVQAVITGTKEVATAVLASMLTTIVVFVPISILDDEIGKIIIVLSMLVVITLVSSVLVAFTLIPTLSENFLKVKSKKQKLNLGLIDRYGSIVSWLTKKKRRRYGIIGLFIIVFISSFLLLPKIPMSVMPDLHNRYAEIAIDLDTGVTPKEREAIAKEVNKQLETIQDVDNNIVMDSVDMLFVLINMTPEEEKTAEQDEVNEKILNKLRQLDNDFPIVNVGSMMDGVSSFPVQIEVSGDNFTELSKISKALEEDLKTIDGISFAQAEIQDTLEEETIVFDEKKMKDDHITTSFLYQEIGHLLSGMPVGELNKNSETQSIIVKNDYSIKKKDDFLKYEITTPTGKEKLSKYVSLEKTKAPAQIERQDGTRYITVMADIEERDLGAVNRDVLKLIQDMDVKQGYQVSVSGDLEEQQKALQDLLLIFAISLFLVFVVMAVQFNSLKHPIIILAIIPLTITGVIIGLFLTQKELNVMSGIGVIMLVGIVLNNGILLIDRAKQLRNQGIHIHEAIVSAAKDRIRPIFMTTLTTVGGMIPLALATNSSSGYQSPLAVVIISGLLFSTLITLVLIPAIYLLFEDIGNGFNKIFKRKKRRSKRKENIRISS